MPKNRNSRPQAVYKMPIDVPVATVAGRKSKKGSSTSKAKKTRCITRYFDVTVRISAEEHARGKPYFEETKRLPRFVLDAYREKLNRAESNDKSARLRILAGNIDILEPVLKEMYAQGKLAFLTKREHSDS